MSWSSLRAWFRSFAAAGPGTLRRPRAEKSRLRRRPQLEVLEDRAVPASLAADFSLLHPYGVLGLDGSKVSMSNPQTHIGGSVGIGPNGVQNFSDGRIDGGLIIDFSTNNSKSNNASISDGVQRMDMHPTVAAALDASAQIAAMTPTQTLGSITGSMTLTSIHGSASSPAVNVIKVGNIQLDGSSTLTLQANDPGGYDWFIFNVTGKFAMTGSSAIKLAPGSTIDSTHVLFNIIGTGEQVAFTGGSTGVGTFLAPQRDISDSGATVNGVLIGAENHQIALTSGARVQVNTPHFNVPQTWGYLVPASPRHRRHHHHAETNAPNSFVPPPSWG